MTIMQQKLLSSGGALDQLAAIDADIAAALSRFGPPPDRSLPASLRNSGAVNYRPTDITRCRQRNLDPHARPGP